PNMLLVTLLLNHSVDYQYRPFLHRKQNYERIYQNTHFYLIGKTIETTEKPPNIFQFQSSRLSKICMNTLFQILQSCKKRYKHVKRSLRSSSKQLSSNGNKPLPFSILNIL